jgi:outer membrane protein
MKKILVVFAVLLMSGFGAAAQKFAYVDSEYILKQIPAYQNAQNQLNTLSSDWQKEIETKYTEIDDLYKEYQSEQILMTEEMRISKEELIIRKEKEAKGLQQKRFGPDGDLFKRREELVKPIQDQVYAAIKKVAKDGSYAIIFDKSSELMMLYTSPRYNKSKDVLDQLGY